MLKTKGILSKLTGDNAERFMKNHKKIRKQNKELTRISKNFKNNNFNFTFLNFPSLIIKEVFYKINDFFKKMINCLSK